MAVYLVLTYDVTDADAYAEYNPGSLGQIFPTVAKHGGEGGFGGHPEFLQGTEASTAVGLKFPDADAAKAWLADEDYAPYRAMREAATTNINKFIVPAMG